MMVTATAQLLDHANMTDISPDQCPHILVLSSSPLIDRILLHTQFLPTLTQRARVTVWATSFHNPLFKGLWQKCPAEVIAFPRIRPFKEFPYNYLRRLNEFVWDFHQRPPSRLSMWRHVRSKNLSATVRALRMPARALAFLKTQTLLEDSLERLLLAYPRSSEASDLLANDRPDLVITTGPFQFEQPAIMSVAKRLGIPTIALIPSWDNISTKPRMVFRYDGYLVWSDQQKQELLEFYPQSRSVPIHVVGAPQYDIFFQERFRLSRQEFCARYGLQPNLPVIVYAVGSPNFISGEHQGALHLARRVRQGELGDVQLIIRPHPLHDNGEMAELFQGFGSRVILQKMAEDSTAIPDRSQDERQIIEWVNTFRHADVVVNLSSTVTVDAAVFNRPVINLDYDPTPGQPHQALIKDVNHLWTHFKPVVDSGGVWLVESENELLNAIKECLREPQSRSEERQWITRYVCGYVDGRCGERMAHSLLSEIYSRNGYGVANDN